MNQVVAAVRTRLADEGRARASASQRQCRAAVLPSTLSAELLAAGTPASLRARAHRDASALDRTSTPISEGRNGWAMPSRSMVAVFSSRMISATRSAKATVLAAGAPLTPIVRSSTAAVAGAPAMANGETS